MRVLLLGSPGPLPFAGHLRQSRVVGKVSLHLAARIAAPDPETAWSRAEAARAALSAVTGADRYSIISGAWSALRPFDEADLVVLFAATDPEGAVLTGAGLDAVYADGAPLVPPGHPLLGPPGIPARTGFYHESNPARTYLGVPTGLSWDGTAIEAAAGVRRWA